jgi:thiol:disulfide interchange protein
VNRRGVPLALLLLAAVAPAQKLNPVQWSVDPQEATAPPGSKVAYLLTAHLEPGWHLYALSVPKPINSTSIRIGESAAIASVGIYQPAPRTIFDPNFGFNVETYEGQATFRVELGLAKDAPAGPLQIAFQTRFQACNDKMCLPPRRVESAAKLLIDPAAQAAALPPLPAGYTRFDPNAQPPAARGASPAAPSGGGGMAGFILLAFGVGLAAIFTPCVFPMIPITVSYFLNKPAGSRARSLADAAAVLARDRGAVLGAGPADDGLAGAVRHGDAGFQSVGQRVHRGVFLAFGLSLLGAFEINIPSPF